MRYRRKMEKTSYIDFTSYKALPMDPVNCFEREQTDYTKADAILKVTNFSLLCYALFFVQILSSEDKNLQENKTKGIAATRRTSPAGGER